MASATVTTKGQITIPVEIRNELQLKPGDQINFAKVGERRVMMIAKNRSVRELKGILGKFDRAWGERPIFGKIRYMSGASTGRKFNSKKYIEQMGLLPQQGALPF